MPRPGPRPYECVRRAWHSDRHQPIRGSLIQEIFRVVNEIHSPATKKNKEWQEKLPVVVLKAEEIMYSKANSEAEYMDPKTLMDRTNDAINTIIRLDESTETGKFLQPCIEAALHLGCTPRRSSRSQRNINPPYYLNVRSQEPSKSENMKPPAIPSSNPTKPFTQNGDFAIKDFSFGTENDVLFEKCPASKYSISPLYCCLRVTPKRNSNTITNPFASNANIEKKSAETCMNDMYKEANYGGCDLSLRLGPLEDTGSNIPKRSKLSHPDDASFCKTGMNNSFSSR